MNLLDMQYVEFVSEQLVWGPDPLQRGRVWQHAYTQVVTKEFNYGCNVNKIIKKIKVNSRVCASMALVCIVCGDDLTEKKEIQKTG